MGPRPLSSHRLLALLVIAGAEPTVDSCKGISDKKTNSILACGTEHRHSWFSSGELTLNAGGLPSIDSNIVLLPGSALGLCILRHRLV